MLCNKVLSPVYVALAIAVSLLLSTQAAAVDKEKVIYAFTGGKGEGSPYAGLVFDKAGNLYGTDCGGAEDYYGTAFELTPAKGGEWKINVLHIFTGATDGSCPRASLIIDKDGNLYGTTTAGGNLNYCNGLGCGTVFRLFRTSSGAWKESVLYSFRDQSDGGYPYASLVLDSAGNLYGTTLKGGDASVCPGLGCGVVFKLTRESNGRFKESVLHTFTDGADGGYPYSSVIFDSAGNLYGTASEGGLGFGTVFELTPGSGGWQQTTLYSFTYGSDGGVPLAGLTRDRQGNLYGTTYGAGAAGNGVVFELQPEAGGWTESVLYSFNGNTDGRYPVAGVIFDAAGNIYGTNSYGGTVEGTVFKLTSGSQGWTEKILHSFTGGWDGGEPEAGVIFDKAGNLYGTTSLGGARGWGCVFQLAPHAP
jgi:uncharacterized repeat protein (TIGR03803 family)